MVKIVLMYYNGFKGTVLKKRERFKTVWYCLIKWACKYVCGLEAEDCYLENRR